MPNVEQLSKWAGVGNRAHWLERCRNNVGMLRAKSICCSRRAASELTDPAGAGGESHEIARPARSTEIHSLAAQCGEFANAEYGFLFDKTRQLLAIGYNVDASRRDDSFYDLLASEARLCCFVAIAQGQLPQESWFALGRLLAGVVESRF